MQQFKRYITEELNVEYEGVYIEFASNVPKSEIVYFFTKGDLQSFKVKAHALYEKYIDEGSKFEINVSSGMRGELYRKMHDQAEWVATEVTAEELSKIFDRVMHEMLMLLWQSQGRFQRRK